MPKQNINANLNNGQLSLDMLSPNDKYYQSIVINQLLEFLYLHPLRRIVTETTFNLYDPTIHDRDSIIIHSMSSRSPRYGKANILSK
jgi:hypothetical protein